MNRIEIEREHWVERYLAGRLSETESRQFETYWIENPSLLHDLERGARLKAGLARLRAAGQLDPLLRSSWWPGKFRLLLIAASVATVAIGVSLWSGTRSSTATMLAALPSALPSLEGAVLPRGNTYTLLRLRAAAPVDALIALPAIPQALALRILPEVALAAPMAERSAAAIPQYNVSLAREEPAGAATRLEQSEGVVADQDGFVTVFVDSRALRAGRYRLRLVPQAVSAGDGGAGFVILVRGGTATP